MAPTVSLVVPVFNESATIPSLLATISAQTLRPDEVIIVDGASTDDTAQRARELARNLQVPIRVISSETRLLPGAGRNVGSENAKSDWIAYTDAGIELDPNWLRSLVDKAMSESADAVFGNLQPSADARFAICAAIAYVPPPSDGVRPMSVASMLLRKSLFSRVGGFPPSLRSAEDLLFIERVLASDARVTRAPDAMVTWHLASSLGATYRRFRTYARSNAAAGRLRTWQWPVLSRYGVLLAASAASGLVAWYLPPIIATSGVGGMLALRAARALHKNRTVFPSSGGELVARFATVAAILGTIDVAMVAGTLDWIFRDKCKIVRQP